MYYNISIGMVSILPPKIILLFLLAFYIQHTFFSLLLPFNIILHKLAVAVGFLFILVIHRDAVVVFIISSFHYIGNVSAVFLLFQKVASGSAGF